MNRDLSLVREADDHYEQRIREIAHDALVDDLKREVVQRAIDWRTESLADREFGGPAMLALEVLKDAIDQLIEVDR